MKTGNKIAWVYTLLTMGLVMAVALIFFLITAHSIDKVYDSYLTERAIVTAEKYWERDELDESDYKQVQKRYEQSLPTAKEFILNADSTDKARLRLSDFLSDEEIDELYKSHILHFSGKEYQRGVALYYPDNEGNFIVVIQSNNKYGADIVSFMGWFLLGAFVVTFILVYCVGKLYAIRLVNRIDEAYQSEKSFIRNASHELNNPLTAILGECEITLLKERKAAEYKSSLMRIESETRRIIMLMKHLLFLSHGDKEIMKSIVEPININQFVRQFENDKVKIIDDGKGFILNANPNLLKIAISNIVNNACKYSGENNVSLSVEDRSIIIEDKGIGIPKDELKNITQPFYRAKNVRSFEGNGIGLALSIKIIKCYGGKVIINSREKIGTRVEIIF